MGTGSGTKRSVHQPTNVSLPLNPAYSLISQVLANGKKGIIPEIEDLPQLPKCDEVDFTFGREAEGDAYATASDSPTNNSGVSDADGDADAPLHGCESTYVYFWKTEGRMW